MNNGTNSKAVLAGEVAKVKFSHEIYDEKFYEVMVTSKRDSGTADVVPVLVSERLIDIDNLLIGKRIKVSGEIRTYNNTPNSERKLYVCIFCFEIEEIDASVPDENEAVLAGFLCKPPVHRITPNGRVIADLMLAVNRAYGKNVYIPTICWGRNANYVAAFSKVGSKLSGTGRLQSRKYHKEDRTYVTYEVSLQSVHVG